MTSIETRPVSVQCEDARNSGSPLRLTLEQLAALTCAVEITTDLFTFLVPAVLRDAALMATLYRLRQRCRILVREEQTRQVGQCTEEDQSLLVSCSEQELLVLSRCTQSYHLVAQGIPVPFEPFASLHALLKQLDPIDDQVYHLLQTMKENRRTGKQYESTSARTAPSGDRDRHSPAWGGTTRADR